MTLEHNQLPPFFPSVNMNILKHTHDKFNDRQMNSFIINYGRRGGLLSFNLIFVCNMRKILIVLQDIIYLLNEKLSKKRERKMEYNEYNCMELRYSILGIANVCTVNVI